jgi:hypothetical protein
MAKKIEIEDIQFVLQKMIADKSEARKIMNEIIKAAAPEDDKEKKPRVKYDFAAIAIDTDLDNAIDENEMFLVKYEETIEHTDVPDLLRGVITRFNSTTKNDKKISKDLVNGFRNVPAKHFKEAGVQVITKEPVMIVIAKNELTLS